MINKKNQIFIKILFLICSLHGVSQSSPLDRKLPDDSYFFNPIVHDVNILEFSNAFNDSRSLQYKIDELESRGGGVLIIKSDTYVLEQIHMKSNVHIKVESGTIFKTKTPKNALFRAGYQNGFNKVTNWSFQGFDKGTFTFDFSNFKPNEKIRAFQLGNAQNFKIADFKVIDNNTKFNAITSEAVGGTPAFFPSFGIIENIGVENAHYGYGVVQIQVGQDLLFRNLQGIGGVTLRLESGYKGLADRYLTDKTIVMNNIYGRNISCKNGAHAVMISPHTIHQGVVDIRNISTISCEASVAINFGFLSRKKDQLGTGHVAGTFSEDSVIANVFAEYGNQAQVRAMRLKFIPCALREYISVEKNLDNESYKAPALSAVYYTSLDGYKSFNNPEGTYQIDVDDVKHSGFSPEVPKNGFITSSTLNDFENCENQRSATIFIKPKERNTQNPLQSTFK
ncbi:hypothetical protein H7U19_12255 [Hyunsoonleella sp. SJ7]|uniref:Uncharacterized protein n=1 Tax=Hyunsoonleella aquatilis TaxID=2762758 RepID=A0A923HB25_9FLAO|nr:hypothetical protein [Hyunsoonleella aquatilis]MBC3759184.1 hypothetical protein [Hyunsoonleella aquatilis]